MPGYKPQVKTNSGMVDIPIAATYDENGNRITKYVSTITQTFTDEEKAQARANIGAADAAGGKTYRHLVRMQADKSKYAPKSGEGFALWFEFIDGDPTAVTIDNIFERLDGKSFRCKGLYSYEGSLSDVGEVPNNADEVYEVYISTTIVRLRNFTYANHNGYLSLAFNIEQFDFDEVYSVYDSVWEMP